MDISPFPHQGPLNASQVRGRDALVGDLIERISARRVTALLGPRRYGKTSVLRKVAAALDMTGASVIWVDLYETRSPADLVVRFDHALGNASGEIVRRLHSMAATASINLGLLKVEFAKPPAQRPDADASLHVVLDLLVSAARSTPTVIVIDEFTGIEGVSGAAGLLRTKLQHHVQEVGLLFAGSQPSAMAAMFTHQAKPFYAQADIVEIEPFSTTDLHDIIEHGFRTTDRDPGSLAASVHSFTGGHPYRAMQLADAAWAVSAPASAYSSSVWSVALSTVRAETAPGIESLFETFGAGEQVVLRAIAGGRPLFGGSLELFGVGSSTVATARDRLIADGTLTREQRIVDPLLADWSRHRFPL